jgi:hypothetical protein
MKTITLKQLEELKKLPDIIMYYRIDDDEESEEVETITQHELEGVIDEMIDESNKAVTIAGNYYNTSRVLKKIDPIAYRGILNHYADTKGWQPV